MWICLLLLLPLVWRFSSEGKLPPQYVADSVRVVEDPKEIILCEADVDVDTSVFKDLEHSRRGLGLVINRPLYSNRPDESVEVFNVDGVYPSVDAFSDDPVKSTEEADALGWWVRGPHAGKFTYDFKGRSKWLLVSWHSGSYDSARSGWIIIPNVQKKYDPRIYYITENYNGDRGGERDQYDPFTFRCVPPLDQAETWFLGPLNWMEVGHRVSELTRGESMSSQRVVEGTERLKLREEWRYWAARIRNYDCDREKLKEWAMKGGLAGWSSTGVGYTDDQKIIYSFCYRCDLVPDLVELDFVKANTH